MDDLQFERIKRKSIMEATKGSHAEISDAEYKELKEFAMAKMDGVVSRLKQKYGNADSKRSDNLKRCLAERNLLVALYG